MQTKEVSEGWNEATPAYLVLPKTNNLPLFPSPLTLSSSTDALRCSPPLVSSPRSSLTARELCSTLVCKP